MMRVLIALAVFLLLIFGVAEWKSIQTPQPEEASPEQLHSAFLAEMMLRTQEFAGWFLQGELENLHDQFTFEMKLLLPFEDLAGLSDRIKTELGEELQLEDESIKPDGENFVYSRVAAFSNIEARVQMIITLNDSQQILGFTIQPVAQSEQPPDEGDDS